TAFFLYGVALIFGATGSTNIDIISQKLQSGNIGLLVYAAMAMMFVGLGFKVAIAPFHIWTPDVYEGAPAPVVGFMSTAATAAAYAAMNVGAFAVVSHFANAGERYVNLEDYEGLGRSSPLLAATLTIFLLSLIGIPITGGFFAKFYVFSAALRADLVWLTLIGVVNSAIGAYYYLRIIVVMYMRESRKEVPVAPVPFGLATALAL